MVPFTYNFETKESKSLLEGIEYIHVPWAHIPSDMKDQAKLIVIGKRLVIALPITQVVDVTIFSIKHSSVDIFIDMRAKIKGITQFTESFTNCEIIENVLVFCRPRF